LKILCSQTPHIHTHTCARTHIHKVMEVFRTAGEVPNGLNVLLLEYKCIWPSFPPLMYLMRHNESLGSMMDRGSDTRQRENKRNERPSLEVAVMVIAKRQRYFTHQRPLKRWACADPETKPQWHSAGYPANEIRPHKDEPSSLRHPTVQFFKQHPLLMNLTTLGAMPRRLLRLFFVLDGGFVSALLWAPLICFTCL